MPRVVPSQVLEAMDAIGDFIKNPPADGIKLGNEYGPRLVGIIKLTEQIPEELIQLSGDDYSDYVFGVGALSYLLASWEGGRIDVPQKTRGTHPLVLIRRSLAKCPDSIPSPTTAELAYLADTDLRNDIRNDLSAANAALHSGEWKSATVLSGSIAEALLLWAITTKRDANARTKAIEALVAEKKLRTPKAEIDRWDLHEYIEVAEALGLIRNNTAVQARLAKDFRNLIHPGRAMRLQEVCSRATALSALAAVEHISRDIA